MNPYQVSQAAYALNYILSDATVQSAMTALDASATANWTTVFDATKAPPFAEGDIPLMNFDLWRANFNGSPVQSGVTIPPATGTDSTVDTFEDARTTYNAGEEGAPTAAIPSIGTSGAAYDLAEWFYNHGVKRAKKQGWHATFKAIWDGAIAQAEEVAARAIQNPDLDGLTNRGSVPLSKLLFQTRQQINKVRTTVQGGAAAVSLHVLFGPMTQLAAGSSRVTTSLVRLIHGSGSLQPIPAQMTSLGTTGVDVAVTLDPGPAFVQGLGVQVDQVPSGAMVSAPATVSGTGTRIGAAAYYFMPGSGTTNQIQLQAASAALSPSASTVRQGQGSLAAASASIASSFLVIGQLP